MIHLTEAQWILVFAAGFELNVRPEESITEIMSDPSICRSVIGMAPYLSWAAMEPKAAEASIPRELIKIQSSQTKDFFIAPVSLLWTQNVK